VTPDVVDALPASVARAVRLTRVTLEARTLLRHLGPWALSARLPEGAATVPLALRQLLKLALLPGDDVHLAAFELSPGDGEASLEVSRAGHRTVIEGSDLGKDLNVLVHRLAIELTQPGDLIKVGETFAMELAREETVRKLSSRMLEVADLDEALYAMLLGITSGYGAGFHRAALFTYDEVRRVFRGSIAIGPRDEEEAHRIWEAIETEDKTLEQALDDYDSRAVVGGYQELVQTLELALADDPEVKAAHAAAAPQVFRAPPESPVLKGLLAPATEFVLAVLQPRGVPLGLIVADNAYGRQPIVAGQIEFLRALVAPTSLVWDTRSLLRRVDSLARHDALTGLFNRRELEERLTIEHSRCARVERPISIAIIDLDHFKEVNDSRGHGTGDALLRRVGVLLGETLRQHDLPVRYGGDEFVLMLPEGTKDELVAVATRVGQRARAEGISLSIGGATWPEDADEPAALLPLADAQLYAAKAGGRGRLCVLGRDAVVF
jgi:diguanylate cyclase (GGDEF)-like protein